MYIYKVKHLVFKAGKMGKCEKGILLFLVTIFTAGLTYSVANITLSKIDVNKARSETSVLDQSHKSDGSVDFEKLKDINPEVQGWLSVKGTSINYPFVRHSDNEYYLTHSFDRTSNRAGWVFMDRHNDINDLDKNTIIYGHGFFENIMFGTLKNVLKKDWYSNTDNLTVTIQTEKETLKWQVFSIYHVKNTSDYIETSFPDDSSYQNFLNLIKDRSLVKFDIQPTTKTKILTLSTCYSRSERFVLHAALIKTVAR